MFTNKSDYRSRIAPSPTGSLHEGNIATFKIAFQRSKEIGGTLILRNEDIDTIRCDPKFWQVIEKQLENLGIDFQESPKIGGPHYPYQQSLCFSHYKKAVTTLNALGLVYPCIHSRREINNFRPKLLGYNQEVIFPLLLRSHSKVNFPLNWNVNWRFRVPDSTPISFTDQAMGEVNWLTGRDFGDFLVWRKEGTPSYELAVVVDDARMQITEIVRGADLLLSTGRQILLYKALNYRIPMFYHCPVINDQFGKKLSKRNQVI